MTAVRVAIADDEALIRAGVATILAADPGIELVGEATDGHEAIELVRRHRVDVLLMDIQMPHLDGVAATREIRRLEVPTRVLILTTFGTDENLRRCLAAGADGFLLKASPPTDLMAGVRAVAEGGAQPPDVGLGGAHERSRGQGVTPGGVRCDAFQLVHDSHLHRPVQPAREPDGVAERPMQHALLRSP